MSFSNVSNDSAADWELRAHDISAKELPDREKVALRWLGRGGLDGKPSGPEKKSNKTNALRPTDLAEIWRTRHSKRLTGKAFYEAMMRDTKNLLLGRDPEPAVESGVSETP